MNSEALKAFFRMGMLIIVLSVIILFVQKPGTPEFFVTIFSVCIGAALVALVAWVARRQ